MATIFIRYANRAGFEIKYGQIDATTDAVQILDYAKAEPDSLYYVRDNYEYVRKQIEDISFNSCLIDSTMYALTDEQAQVLVNTGEAVAVGNYGVSSIKVYLAPAAAKLLEQVGNESLARCYAKLAEARDRYKQKALLQQALLAAANGQPIKQPVDSNTLATDIETFLKNRDKCLAALKPKRKRTK